MYLRRALCPLAYSPIILFVNSIYLHLLLKNRSNLTFYLEKLLPILKFHTILSDDRHAAENCILYFGIFETLDIR